MNSVEGKKKGETNINTSNTNKETNKEDLFSQVGKLTVHNENRVYNTDQIKKFVPYQKVAQAKARAISRQEKKLEEMQIKSVENLLNQIQMCQRYRKKLEKMTQPLLIKKIYLIANIIYQSKKLSKRLIN